MHRLRGRSPSGPWSSRRNASASSARAIASSGSGSTSETHSRIWRPPASKGTPRPAATSSTQRAAGSFTVMRSPRVSIAKILPFVRRPEALKSLPSSTSGSPSSRTAIDVNSSSLGLASVSVMGRFIQWIA